MKTHACHSAAAPSQAADSFLVRLLASIGRSPASIRIRSWIGSCLLLLWAINASAADVSGLGARLQNFFDQALVRTVVNSDATLGSLWDRNTSTEWLSIQTNPIAAVVKGGVTYPATDLLNVSGVVTNTSVGTTHLNNEFLVRFGASGITAKYSITNCANYVVFTLKEISDMNVDEVRILQVQARCQDYNGSEFSGVVWNGTYSVGLYGLSERVNVVAGEAGLITASVYPSIGMINEQVALLAAPTAQYLAEVQKMQKGCGLPSPTLDGTWAKTSSAARGSYLFADMTAANADEMIRYAKMGGFKYILIYYWKWAESIGSYPIKLKNYPNGEASLISVVNKCHAAGIKVGLHFLTSMIEMADPLVTPKLDSRMYKDYKALLAYGIGASDTTITTTAPLTGFPTSGTYLRIDDEVIQFQSLGGTGPNQFLNCLRGCLGTTATAHSAGAVVGHLAMDHNRFIADLTTSLKGEIAARIAGIVNRCGIDMIYCDAGEINAAQGPHWYWVSLQQSDICSRLDHDVLVQGSGNTQWLWHWFTRYNSDDFATVAAKTYLDYYKIGYAYRVHSQSLMPGELGWWGLLTATSSNPSTTPDEAELYAVRMLAYDMPVGLETSVDAIKANGRSEEMLNILGSYEALRLGSTVPVNVRNQLKSGEWKMTGAKSVSPIVYDAQRINTPGSLTLTNVYGTQTAKFRMQAATTLAAPGNASNLKLLTASAPVRLKLPGVNDKPSGYLVGRVNYTKAPGSQASVFLTGSGTNVTGTSTAGKLDLTTRRGLAVTLYVDSAVPAASDPCSVLGIQLETSEGFYRDYYIDLNFTGYKTIIIPEPTPERMLRDFWPNWANYSYKNAIYHFNHTDIVALNVRWLRLAQTVPPICRLAGVEALAETEANLVNPRITVGGSTMVVPASLKVGDYMEYWGDGIARIFDVNGILLNTVTPSGAMGALSAGNNTVTVAGDLSGAVKFTGITMGTPVTW